MLKLQLFFIAAAYGGRIHFLCLRIVLFLYQSYDPVFRGTAAGYNADDRDQ